MNPVLEHLTRHVRLSVSAQSEFATFVQRLAKPIAADDALLEPGDRGKTFILVSGWIVREASLADGRRQITALFLPGDIFDLHADLIPECGYRLRAVTDGEVAVLSRSDFQRLVAASPEIAEALTWEQLEQLANQTEWLTNLGQRKALERVAHFFCEVFWRLNAIGLARENQCDMPFTQAELAEVLGMTPVHLNRCIQELRGRRVVELRGHKLRVIDGSRLAEIGLFDPGYLELDGVIDGSREPV